MDITKTQGKIVTYSGIVLADLVGNTFYCPACKQAPDLTALPTDDEVWLICMTEGCKNHVAPIDYKGLYDGILQRP